MRLKAEFRENETREPRLRAKGIRMQGGHESMRERNRRRE
jgi:hypothetical protein